VENGGSVDVQHGVLQLRPKSHPETNRAV
jgi:hypothetical protein